MSTEEIPEFRQPTYSVVVADDHGFLRQALRSVLENCGSFQIVAEASDGLEAIALLRRHRPSLLTLDLAMPHAQGLTVFLEARRWSPETRTVVLTGMTSRTVLADLIKEGVNGLFMKNGDPELMEVALPKIMAGEQVISPDVLALIEGLEDIALTSRERQVLTLIAMGHTSKAISEQLGVSYKTVDHHRTNLMRKLNLRSAAELLSYALREGYFDHARET